MLSSVSGLGQLRRVRPMTQEGVHTSFGAMQRTSVAQLVAMGPSGNKKRRGFSEVSRGWAAWVSSTKLV